MSLSLISYFICSKASNQSDLMQHNVHAAIFHLAQYSVCSIRQRRRRGFRCAARHSAACFFTQARCRQHTKICITHGNTVCVRRVFRVSGEMFQWRKSSVCCFGARGTSISLVPPSTSSFVLVPQQMAAVNFGHFYCVKLFVEMDRKVTSI